MDSSHSIVLDSPPSTDKDKGAGPRSAHRVLVPNANAIGMIGCIRSLGGAGYVVHACDAMPDALGFRSRFAAQTAVYPSFDDPGFIPWLRDYVRDHKIECIVPSEGLLIGIRSVFNEFAPLMPISRDSEIVYRCFSKCDVLHTLMNAEDESRHHLPPTRIVSDSEPLASARELDDFPLPIFVKSDAAHAHADDDGEVHRAGSPDEAFALVESLSRRFAKVLVQGNASGTKASVHVCLSGGEIIAQSMCLARHQTPHTGGLMTLRQTWWHEGMHRDALAKLEKLGWDGIAMMEYKWDPKTDDFRFIEINSRYWGALHLDLFAGVDYPRIQVDDFLGYPRGPMPKQATNCVVRFTIPAEVAHATSRLKDPDLPLPARLWSVVEFALLFITPGVKSDLYFPGDRELYWIQWGRFLKGLFRA